MTLTVASPAVGPAGGASRLRRRGFALAASVTFVAVGVAYSLLWAPVVRHHPYWIQPGDLWATYRTAHYVGWGDLGGVYAASTALVTFPGILLALAPVAMLTGALGLSESFPKFLPHPTAWLLLDPWMLIVSAVAIVAADALAEHLGASRRRRMILCVAQAAVLWNLSVIWGHPEDAVAVGLALYGIVFALQGRWTGAGWLFGAALATQPLVLLVCPIVLGLAGRRQIFGLVCRMVAPPALLIATPLVSQFAATTHALLDQPNFPRLDHATPWTALAPALGGHGRNVAVAAGPGRLVAVVLAGGLGWMARRWRHRPEAVVGAVAVALALRCLTESVMVAFYIWPALAVALVAAATVGGGRLFAAAGVALVTSMVAQSHLGELPWWMAVVGGTVAAVGLGLIPARGWKPVTVSSGPRRGREPPPVLVGAIR